MSIIVMTAADITGIVTANVTALFASTVNAIIAAPNTTNGERNQSQTHVHALLNLLDVCRHTGYESGSSEFVRVRVRKRLYAREQRMTEF